MYSNRYSARLSIALLGEDLTLGVSSFDNPDSDGGRWVSVRTGPVLTYCADAATVAGIAAAWADALVKGRRVLPATSTAPPSSGRESVIAQVSPTAEDTWDIDGYTAHAARDGVAVLFVRTGALTIRCHDQATVATIARVWADARQLSDILWRVHATPDR
jgi:hypothetical protein